ncbi:transcriptional regulator family: Fungal Specific TF [Paecilomyces variotii]|nr:transcriptional regulator family: Fungal Specific TF [Paecilomyces variotii]KAJ9222796.1 transcriptional regulator family: Fungal Specific TF [Paecilomyces variotii]KAJ9275201.1 transcriptional regulator family: Fungal Specific TF [Paecilomyces variotii]KAJ9312167.1 transcriptional regulator family: Fungal Specific TF [Paecilomyces variotii]KAJ9341351.1 transcriptional regulator family: Fungal Specific TF [Paecilomyces variotii]
MTSVTRRRGTAAAQRSRSMGGCSTCRERHNKCDETRPRCQVCERLGLECAGYDARISFIFEGCESTADSIKDTAHNAPLFRRPLYTDLERQSMSEQLILSCPRTVNEILSLLDSEGFERDEPAPRDIDIVQGPFGVFSLENSASHAVDPASSDTPSSSMTPVAPVDPFAAQIIETAVFLDRNEFLGDGVDLESDKVFSYEELSSPLDQLCDLQADQAMFTSEIDLGNGDICPNEAFTPSLPMSSISLVPPDATFLLSHYRDVVINFLSPLQYKKSPWRTMFLPSAMNTLATLTLGQSPNNASFCIFSAILATSASHLGNTVFAAANQYWNNRSERYFSIAQQSLKLALKDEALKSPPKKAKYKEILMSLLSMTTASIFSGLWKHTRCYLLDAEKLIRQRGLPKRHKSRKVRLLHHCYAYMRVMHETTVLASGEQEIESSQPSERYVDKSPLRVQKWDGRLDQRLLMNKESDLGENDLLLAVPGRWDSTLYPSMYGLPESFLVMLSETLRLANERITLQRTPDDCKLTWKQYLFRAKILEKCVCSWEPTVPGYPEPNNTSVSDALVALNRRLVDCMLHAMHQALIIYFYRMIHDIDPFILQDRVAEALEYLLEWEHLKEDARECAAPFAWTGFIVACEALDQATQEKFSTWFSTCAKRSGIKTFQVAHQIAQQIWTRRQEASAANPIVNYMIKWPKGRVPAFLFCLLSSSNRNVH